MGDGRWAMGDGRKIIIRLSFILDHLSLADGETNPV